MKHLLYAACCVLAGWFTNAQADTFKVGFYNYPPMMIESGRTGIYQDILDELSIREMPKYSECVLGDVLGSFDVSMRVWA